jgi:glycosyltransferase involved in cell wall biosynthesis
MRVPVVAFGVPGVVDAVSNGVTGTLVAPLSVDALAAALCKYLHNPSLRLQHGAAGRDWASACFDREKVWTALTKFYSSMNFAQHIFATPAPRTQSAVASR